MFDSWSKRMTFSYDDAMVLTIRKNEKRPEMGPKKMTFERGESRVSDSIGNDLNFKSSSCEMSRFLLKLGRGQQKMREIVVIIIDLVLRKWCGSPKIPMPMSTRK